MRYQQTPGLALHIWHDWLVRFSWKDAQEPCFFLRMRE